MMKIRVAVIVMMFTVPSIAQQVHLSREVKMLALGDSYTIGESVKLQERWPHQLIDQLRSMGIEAAYPDYIATTGWTTRNLIQGIATRLDSEKSYNLVSILIGVNNQYQGAAIELFEPDLREIIDLALDLVNRDPSRVLVLSIPDYAYTPFGEGSEAISLEIDAYNAIKRKVANESRIPFVDITQISREGLINPLLVAADGLHPSGLQYAKWVAAIVPFLRTEEPLSEKVPEQDSGSLISIYPNPANFNVYIDSTEDIARICIVDVSGTILLEEGIESLPADISLTHLESGVYVLCLCDHDDQTISRRTLLVASRN